MGLVLIVFALWICGNTTSPTPQPTPEGIEITLRFEQKRWNIPPQRHDIPPVTTLPAGIVVRVIRHVMVHNGFWLFIRTEGYEGYIEEGYGMLTIEQRAQLK